MNKEINEVWNVMMVTGKVGYYNFFATTIRLLFVKYIALYSDKLNIKTLEDYKVVTSFARKYEEARTGKTPLKYDDLAQVLSVIDYGEKEYNASLFDMLDGMQFFFDEAAQIRLMDAISKVDLPSNPNEMKMLFSGLMDMNKNDVRRTGECTTSSPLRSIASQILMVNQKDVFLNSYAGYSSMLLNVDGCKEYIAYDLLKESTIVSMLLNIMLGNEHFSIRNVDFLYDQTTCIADKIFTDSPLGLRREMPPFEYLRGISTKEIEGLSVLKTIDSLKENGTAIIAVPGKILFSNNKSLIEVRKECLDNGLKAIIALPPLWNGTSIPTYLLVINKGFNGEITMVDVSGDEKVDMKKLGTMPKEKIDIVVNAVNKNLQYEYLTTNVSRSSIANGESWVPSKYLPIIDDFGSREVSEIDNELDALYKELMENIKSLNR